MKQDKKLSEAQAEVIKYMQSAGASTVYVFDYSSKRKHRYYSSYYGLQKTTVARLIELGLVELDVYRCDEYIFLTETGKTIKL